MNNLKPIKLRKKLGQNQEEEKVTRQRPNTSQGTVPHSFMNTIGGVGSKFDLRQDDPLLAGPSTPIANRSLIGSTQCQSNNISKRSIYRQIEEEARRAEEEAMRETINHMNQSTTKFTKEELSTVLESNRKKFKSRPMTATYPKKNNDLSLFTAHKDLGRSRIMEEPAQVAKPEVVISKKVPDSANISTTQTEVKQRPRSKISLNRKGIANAKSKLKVKMDRKVDMKSVILAKNNEKFKLASTDLADQNTAQMKRLERKLDHGIPFAGKNIELGPQKSLFPSRKTEQEMIRFADTFVEPTPKDLGKLKGVTKIEGEEFELKKALIKPKRKLLKPIKVKKHFDVDLSQLNTDHHSKKRFEELLSNFKKSIDTMKIKEDDTDNCLIEGKKGLELYLNKNYDSALVCFKNTLNLGQSLKNSKLRLDCLVWIGYTLRILLENKKTTTAAIPPQADFLSSSNEDKSEELIAITVESLETAYALAKALNETKLSQELMCNLGIIRGNMTMSMYADQHLATLVNTESLYGDLDDDEEAIEGEEDEETKEQVDPDDYLEDLPVGEAFM
ncbi:unnamed protein product [Moneuplotes crassus]|uniref:Uncharacterized protein n=1 Tax=Euplotes crassus TaxID=5936 RepID=A0AAD1UAW6_EUPCR|nr:unnamed protein product [Moneuplotes crassus]